MSASSENHELFPGDADASKLAEPSGVAPYTNQAQEPSFIGRRICAVAFADLWDLVDERDEPVFAWHDPSASLQWVASGTVSKAEFHGPSRFEDARQWVAKLTAALGAPQGQPLTHNELPFILGGFAFAAHGNSPSTPWQDWPSGLLLVPRRIAFRQRLPNGESRTGVVLHVATNVDTTSAALDAEERSVRALLDKVSPSLHLPPPLASPEAWSFRAMPSAETYQARVARVVQSIEQSSLEKVVLARANRIRHRHGHSIDPRTTLRALRQGCPHSISFAFCRGSAGSFLGATPETLVRMQGGEIRTHALAGTIARSPREEEDQLLGQRLLDSDKDRHEHALVVAGMRRALGTVCEHLTIDDAPQLVKLASVQHLGTRLQGRLKARASLLDAVQTLHPTPALCGWPSAAAMQWLKSHERLDRGWYAGPIGWLAPNGDGVFSVAIRSALLRNDEAWAFGGAGIVQGSVPEAEWRETELKLQTVSDHLVPRLEGRS